MAKPAYNEVFKRNKGIINNENQKLLKTSTIAVLGLGGLGGVISEILARCGIENFKLIDKDIFDASNMNRQIYATMESLGRYKTDETEARLKQINPDIKSEKYLNVSENNIDAILSGVDIALLALDETVPCIIISRKTRELNIPLVEGWALPYGNVRVFTHETPTLEEVYNLPTIDKELDNLTLEEKQDLNLYMLMELKKINGIIQYYTEDAEDRIRQKLIPSFAPLVWLTACIMSLEAIKVLLKQNQISLSPKLNLFDPFLFKVY